MTHAIKQALADGQTLAINAGPATVSVQAVRIGQAYRASIRYRSTGAEVDELSRSYPSELQARRAARMAVQMFHSGWTVAQMLDALACFALAA